MKLSMIGYLAFASFLATVAGCTAETSSESSPSAATTATTEQSLTLITSQAHPSVTDGRVVENWHASVSATGGFRLRGVDASGATLADFAFVPGHDGAGTLTSMTIEVAAPERGVIRIVDGQLVESVELSASTLSLIEAMATDLEVQGAGDPGALQPQGFFGCIKWTALVVSRCGAGVLSCLKHISSATAIARCAESKASSCRDAAKTWFSLDFASITRST